MGKDKIEMRSSDEAAGKILNENAYRIQRSCSKALASSFVHIVPVGITFSILQLSFRNVYWVAAKVHEILILVSMSSMVLHYVRKLMVTPGGMSFGLLEAAYQSGLSSNPWTIGNWEALKHLNYRIRGKNKSNEAKEGISVRSWHLVVLLVTFAFLAIFIGPASAITLIPQLGWWHREDLIGPLQNSNHYLAPSFSVYVPTNLFPTEIDASHLPGSFCIDAAKDVNNTCPSARTAEVQGSFTVPAPNNVKTQNTTISLGENDELPRQMLYMQDSLTGRAAVTVPNYLLASFTSLIRLPSFINAGNYEVGGPFTIETFANGAAPLNPLVDIDCKDTTNDLFIREYNYEIGGFDYNYQEKVTLEDVRKIGVFDIRSVWSEDQLQESVNGTELVWKDVTDMTNTPVLLGLVRHGRNTSVCAVQSYWTPTSQWVLSTSNYNVATNFTFSDTEFGFFWSMYGYPYALNTRRLRIHEDWVETLNAANGSTKVIDALLQYGIKTIRDSVLVPPSNLTTTRDNLAYELFESTIAQILAKTIANGLSRIGAQYAADRFSGVTSLNELTICNEKRHWCSQGPWIPSRYMPLAVTANNTREETWLYFSSIYSKGDSQGDWYNDTNPIMRSFPKPAEADKNWTRINFPVRRYGYAYAFQGITTYLSVALLYFHAAIIVIHIIYRVALDYQNFDFGRSLGSLLLLAMGDRAPAGGDLWKKRVAVVPYGNSAEQNKLKLDVIETKYQDEEKTPRADPEEVERLVSTMHLKGQDSRYPSV